MNLTGHESIAIIRQDESNHIVRTAWMGLTQTYVKAAMVVGNT